jgi:hypothetical protein
MTIPQRRLLLAAGGLLSAGSMAKWKPADRGSAIAYARRCQLGQADAPMAAAVALWVEDIERHPCPGRAPS